MARYIVISQQRRYGFWNFVLDAFMFCATGGLWIIWIIIRQNKNN